MAFFVILFGLVVSTIAPELSDAAGFVGLLVFVIELFNPTYFEKNCRGHHENYNDL